MLYSKTTGGFYTVEIHGTDIPNDAIEVPDETYQSLLDGQGNGKQIGADEKGFPILVEPTSEPTPPPTKEELMKKLLEIQQQLENL